METDSQTRRTDLWLPRWGGWEKDGVEVGASRCKLLHTEGTRCYCTAQRAIFNVL